MNVRELTPKPSRSEPFRRSCERFFTEAAGCYVLTAFDGRVLYVGLADNIRRRVNQHLDSPAKTNATTEGRAVFVHWMETKETNKVERTWMNVHISNEGRLPILNLVFSPAPRRFVWNPTLTMAGRRRARWACGQAAFEPVHMSTGRLLRVRS